MKWGVHRGRHVVTGKHTRAANKLHKLERKGTTEHVTKARIELSKAKKNDEALTKYVKNASVGKLFAQDMLMGPVGSRTYAEERIKGTTRKNAAVKALIDNNLAIATLGITAFKKDGFKSTMSLTSTQKPTDSKKKQLKALYKEYGDIEDKATYGKGTDPKTIAATQRRLDDLDKKINSLK